MPPDSVTWCVVPKHKGIEQEVYENQRTPRRVTNKGTTFVHSDREVVCKTGEIWDWKYSNLKKKKCQSPRKLGISSMTYFHSTSPHTKQVTSSLSRGQEDLYWGEKQVG